MDGSPDYRSELWRTIVLESLNLLGVGSETITAWGEHYGADALISNAIRHARQDITRRGRAEYAAQIRSWRTQSGMTLRQLARAAGTSPSRLSDYENAKVAPTTDVLARLKHAAGTHHPQRW